MKEFSGLFYLNYINTECMIGLLIVLMSYEITGQSNQTKKNLNKNLKLT
jgi:hypothetical protein